MPENSSLIREFDSNLIEQVKEAYLNKKDVENSNEIELKQYPFTHGAITDLVTDLDFIKELTTEMKSKLKYLKKNNDLYKFHQTGDLANSKLKNIRKFRDQVLYASVLKTLEKITNIELSSKIDFTSSKYEHTDYLLCHDDDIHDDTNRKGRRIAFIYYLVPDDWCAKDGGNLDLFNVNQNLQPMDKCKSIQPRFNTLLFFEVSDRSFHQVAEVLSKSKTRYSINGWFHGDINYRPEPFIEIVPEPSLYIDIDATIFFDWITEKYLKPLNQTAIQLKFSSSSEIKLDNIFNATKYEQISEALTSENIVWDNNGPANRRNYQVAKLDTLPPLVVELIQVLTCDHMGLTLANMTGLALHSSVPKRKDDDNDDDDSFDDEDEDEDNEETEGKDYDDLLEEKDDDIKKDGEENTSNDSLKRKIEEVSQQNTEKDECSKPGTSQSKQETSKKLKSENDNSASTSSTMPSTSAAATQNGTDSQEKPKCYVEIRKWKQGNYTLVTDDDNQIKTKALDLMLFFKCKSWSIESGGNVSYIARDEDSELLTVNPEENCLALVYRDEETLKFTKYVNSNINELNQFGCFFEISVVYYE